MTDDTIPAPDDDAAALEAFIAEYGPFPPFRPHAYYNRDGDQIEVYWDDASCYAEWLGPGIGFTLHRAQDDDRVVGVTITGVRRLMGKVEKSDP